MATASLTIGEDDDRCGLPAHRKPPLQLILICGRLLLVLLETLGLAAEKALHHSPHPLFLLVRADKVATFWCFLLIGLLKGVEVVLVVGEEVVKLLVKVVFR
jgi:hypothetical protein